MDLPQLRERLAWLRRQRIFSETYGRTRAAREYARAALAVERQIAEMTR